MVVPILSYQMKPLSEHHLTRKCVRRKKNSLLEKERNRLKPKRKPNADKKNRRRQKDQHSQKEDKGNVILSFVRSE